jgi:isoleucyl-tRNA synthetase
MIEDRPGLGAVAPARLGRADLRLRRRGYGNDPEGRGGQQAHSRGFVAEGADAWFAEGAKERFLGNDATIRPSGTRSPTFSMSGFDSGSTHTFTLEDRDDLKWPADVYLEGSDQHRGWFHSSLLESCGTRGRAPYDTVITHGFTMAEDGRKMSKSLEQPGFPQDVMAKSGADILRLWVMNTDYWEDQRLGQTIIQTNIDAYRKMRNTMRWMLGTLAHDTGESVAHADMPELERLMLHRLWELDASSSKRAMTNFDFKRISRAPARLHACIELSAFYFDIRKDALYCDAPSSVRRRAALQVVRTISSTAWSPGWRRCCPSRWRKHGLTANPDATLGAS